MTILRLSRAGSCVLALLLTMLLLTPARAADLPDHTLHFDIPAGALSQALRAFGQTAGQQIIFTEDLVSGMTFKGLKGDFPVETALQKLLEGTGLASERSLTGVIMIRRAAAPRAAQPPPTSGGLTGEASQVAQPAAGQTEERVSVNQSTEDHGKTSESRDQLQQVVVTGTHIHGIETPTTFVETYSRADIDSSGYLTTQDFVRSIPQNFKGGDNGASEDGFVGSTQGLSNIESASGIDLRGFGTSSTLVLLNGHRVAPADSGTAVDVSMIPLSAIDHIEVLTDGASAIYGSDAVGGVVNFSLRKDYSGAETTLQGGTVTSGSHAQYTVDQTIGKDWSTGNVLTAFQYADSSALSSADRSFTQLMPQPNDLYPATRQYSAMISGHQELLPKLDFFTDLIYDYRSDFRLYSAPPNQIDSLGTGTDFYSANGGLDWNPFGSWKVELSALTSKVDASQKGSFSPLPTGYVDGELYVRNAYSIQQQDLVADGKIFAAPGGPARLAIGGSYRTENFSSQAPWASVSQGLMRDVGASFAEIYIPLVGDTNALPFVRNLVMSASIRHDHYTDFGDTSNPKYGVLWSPGGGFDLRASYGTSFHAPDAAQEILNATNKSVFNYPFASPSGGTTPVLISTASPGLKPEASRNLNVGAEFHPAFAPADRVFLTYYDVVYHNRLVSPPFDPAALLQPNVYGPLITHFANDAQAASYLSALEAQGFMFTDFTGTGTQGVLNAYSIGLTNATYVRQNGLDGGFELSTKRAENSWSVRWDATYINQISTGFCATCTTTDLVNTFGEPLHFRSRLNGRWGRSEWEINAAVNYAGSYKDTSAVPYGTVGSYTTVDFNARYSPQSLRGFTVGLSITNALNRNPPYTLGSLAYTTMHYDTANADPLGRMVSLLLRQAW